MICKNCGSTLNEGAQFCINCGMKLPVKPRKSRTGLIVGICVGVAVIIIGSFAFMMFSAAKLFTNVMEDAREVEQKVVREFYNAVDEKDYNKAASYFDSTLFIESYGSLERGIKILESFREFHGTVDSIKTISTNSNTENGVKTYTFEYMIIYSDVPVKETIVVRDKSNELKIIKRDIIESDAANITKPFFEAVQNNDAESLKKQLSESFAMSSQDFLSVIDSNIVKNVGSYENHGFVDLSYMLYNTVDNPEQLCCVITEEVMYGSTSFYFWVGYCRENGSLRVKKVDAVPKAAYDITDNYYKSLAQEDYEAASAYNSQELYKSVENGKEGWKTILKNNINTFGKVDGNFAIIAWKFMPPNDNNQAKMLLIYNTANYGSEAIYEQMILTVNDPVKVIAHRFNDRPFE